MGAQAYRAAFGPNHAEVDFPGVFEPTFFVQSPNDIVDAVEILEPKILPQVATIGGGMGVGLVIKRSGLARDLRFRALETQPIEASFNQVFPLEEQYYFALTARFEGERYRTPRICVGKVALLDDVVVCEMPVKEIEPFAKKVIHTDVVEKEEITELSVASAVFNILNDKEILSSGAYANAVMGEKLKRAARRQEAVERSSKFTHLFHDAQNQERNR